MNYVRLTPDGLQYPYSLWQLRLAYPNTSFPADPSADDLAPFDCYPVALTPQPEPDPRTQMVEQATPVQMDGQWVQAWTVRAATAEEIAAYDAAHAPQPEWVAFSTALMAHPQVNTLLGQLLAQAPGLYGGLVVGLNEASKGDTRVFLTAWSAVEALGLVTVALADVLYSLATAHHLPIAATFLPTPESVGQEHTTPDGQLWRVAQARNDDGTFTTDDPATPERESLEWVRVSAT